MERTKLTWRSYTMIMKRNGWCFRPPFSTVRLYWAGVNLGEWDEFCYGSCPWCRIDRVTCCPAVQRATTVPWMPPQITLKQEQKHDQVNDDKEEEEERKVTKRGHYTCSWAALSTLNAAFKWGWSSHRISANSQGYVWVNISDITHTSYIPHIPA